jgi:hypothetical protein
MKHFHLDKSNNCMTDDPRNMYDFDTLAKGIVRRLACLEQAFELVYAKKIN